jgi:DNA-binding NarL/FixJ family response regulator
MGKTMKSVSILIADDHAVVRRGLRALLGTQRGWSVCAEATDGRMAVEKAGEHQPDIVILDIGMPELSGLDAMVKIRDIAPQTRILVLTMHGSEEWIQSCLSAGAQGYVLKSDAERNLISAVEALARHETFFTTGAINVLHDDAPENSNMVGDGLIAERLTNRENEIAQLLAEGKSNKEVGARLGISTRTVESHRAAIMSKLQLRSVSELVRYAIRRRMIEP